MPRPRPNIVPEIIDELKTQIEHHFGQSIQSVNDCQLLAERIESKTGASLSLNTLRRLFGLIHSTSLPTQNTLDILSRYCGFNRFSELQASLHLPEIKFHGLTFDSVNSLYERDMEEGNFLRMLNWLIVLAFQQRNYDFLKRIFDLEVFKTGNHYNGKYPRFLDTMLTLGVEMRKHPHMQDYLWKVFATNPIARFIYYEHFVDHDYLAIRHHKAIGEYLKHIHEPDASLFGNCLLFLKSLLQGNASESKQHIRKIDGIKITSGMHPFPVSRMVSCNLLFQYSTTKRIDEAWIDYVFQLESGMPRTGDLNRNIPIFHMMVSEALVWCRKYDEAKLLIEKAIESYPFLSDDSIFGNAAANAKLKTYYAKTLLESNQYHKAAEVYNSIQPDNFDIQSRQFDYMHYYQVGADIFKQKDIKKSQLYSHRVSDICTDFGFDFFAKKYTNQS